MQRPLVQRARVHTHVRVFTQILAPLRTPIYFIGFAISSVCLRTCRRAAATTRKTTAGGGNGGGCCPAGATGPGRTRRGARPSAGAAPRAPRCTCRCRRAACWSPRSTTPRRGAASAATASTCRKKCANHSPGSGIPRVFESGGLSRTTRRGRPVCGNRSVYVLWRAGVWWPRELN